MEEPVYQGVPYNTWLMEYPLKSARTEALGAIGTNALPYLTQEISATDTFLQQEFMHWVSRIFGTQFGFRPARQRQTTAWIGFVFLGEEAKPWLRELLSGPDPVVREYVRTLLSELDGREGRAVAGSENF